MLFNVWNDNFYKYHWYSNDDALHRQQILKTAWMQLNPTRLIDLKMKLSFDKTKMLRLCSNLSLMMNHRKNLKYCMINIKVDKTCRATDDTIKKNYFLNNIWLKLCRDNSKLNFVLTILKTHKNETMLFVSHFSEIFMCVKRVSRYFTVFLMFITLRSEIFSREFSSV